MATKKTRGVCITCGKEFVKDKKYPKRDLCSRCLNRYNNKVVSEFVESSGIF